MTHREILEEVQRLPLAERLAIIDALVHQVRTDVAQWEQTPPPVTREQIAAAVELMREEYETDKELTALTVLDSEDFLA